MITSLTIEHFKRLEKVSFDLTERVVLIGPNNSGKSSILQALTLWEAAVRKWAGRQLPNPGIRATGIPLNRKDLLNLPVPSTRLLWYRQQVRTAIPGKQRATSKVLIRVVVEGLSNEETPRAWRSGFEFDFANSESLTCRPVFDEQANAWVSDAAATEERVAYLQPMSGLAVREDLFISGTIQARIGEGKTADVLRNICYQLWQEEERIFADYSVGAPWTKVKNHLRRLFGVELDDPELIPENGTIELTYREDGNKYDLSSGGRGFLQTLLLLAYMYSAPGRVVLLDEPDAHLEVIRQREIFELLKTVTTELGSQLIIASHSEVVLNEAASGDTIIAVINNQTRPLTDHIQRKHLRQALAEIGWEKYYLATLRGHVLYLEGSTDWQMLLALARHLKHPVEPLLAEANIQYVSLNKPGLAYHNFQALRSTIPNLRGLALFDRLEVAVSPEAPLQVIQWRRRELENYFATPAVLKRYAIGLQPDLFAAQRVQAMEDALQNSVAPRYLHDPDQAWWRDGKLSDEFLDPVLQEYATRLKLPVRLFKTNFHELIQFVDPQELDSEVFEKLDVIETFLQSSPPLLPE